MNSAGKNYGSRQEIKDIVFKHLKDVTKAIDTYDIEDALEIVGIQADEINVGDGTCTLVFYPDSLDEGEAEEILEMLSEKCTTSEAKYLNNAGLGWDMEGKDVQCFYIDINVEELLQSVAKELQEKLRETEGSTLVNTKKSIKSPQTQALTNAIRETHNAVVKDITNNKFFVNMIGEVFEIKSDNIHYRHFQDEDNLIKTISDDLESIDGVEVLSVDLEKPATGKMGSFRAECTWDIY